jgi:hypothetical protein
VIPAVSVHSRSGPLALDTTHGTRFCHCMRLSSTSRM